MVFLYVYQRVHHLIPPGSRAPACATQRVAEEYDVTAEFGQDAQGIESVGSLRSRVGPTYCEWIPIR